MVLDAVPLVATTTLFIGIFLYFVVRLQLDDIRANWQERRCEAFVIPLAHLIPTDQTVDTSEFSAENFQFCMNKILDASIALATAPMQKGFVSQLQAVKPINDSINYLRANALSLLEPLNKLMNNMWAKVILIVYQFIRVFTKLSSSFDRIFGIAVSSIFAGIGMYKGIRNALNFVIYVILIILIILLVMVVFLFFMLIPVMPVILTTLGVISASVFGASVGGMAESFCVAPGTLVAVKEGWKKVEELRLGDELRDGSVEGILKASGTKEQLVIIDGVIIAACHIVKHGDEWISAGEHPLSQLYKDHVNELYCLNTTSRTWIVKANNEELVLRDWEELPLDASLSVNAEWESLIYYFLNDPSPVIQFPRIAVPGRGLVGENALVMEKKRGFIPISQIKIGDFIEDSPGVFTQVLAIYQDYESVPRSGVNHASWIWNSHLELWTHPVHYSEEALSCGYQLITKSGMFLINTNTCVRDFTEIGLNRIKETYPFVLSHLNHSDSL